MYTQCPECDVAFRVTAEVLKQAAGKVRCGGCGIAFNALAHLSEEMPGAPMSEETSSADIDDVGIIADEPAELEAGTPPKAISAEQSVALLKTLDQLAGDDVRIEDTGVEWRVMNEGDDEDEFADDPVPSIDHDEMRFDDNTPLPDDFDLDTPSTLPPPIFIAPDSEPEPEPQLDASQTNLAFGEPDEWEDLLDDLDEAVEAAETAVEEGAEPLDMDAQFALQAEELGLDLSSVQDMAEDAEEEESDTESEEEAEELEEELPEEPEEEPEERETTIDEDLIAAAFEVEAAARQESADEINLEDANPDELSRAGILDEDDYLKEITEEDEAEVFDDMKFEDSDEDRRLAEEVLVGEPELEDEHEPEEESEPEQDSELEEELLEEEEELEELDEDPEDDLPNEEDLAADLQEALAGLNEDEDEPEEVTLEEEAVEFSEPLDADVPEPTEEEKTLNMMIDQDLLAIAVEDDDGFTSTIVQKQVSSSDDIPNESKQSVDEAVEEEASPEEEAAAPPDGNPLMETIIMEGESVHNEEDAERLEAARMAAAESLKQSGFEEDKKSFRDWQPPRHSMAAAAALLFVVLVVQVIHHSREALAVSTAFQNTIGPVYRMVGSPITPAWDVKGWRFEATKGNTNDEGEGDVLTIYSRVGNNSDKSLPYPLVHVSLSDRFEEVIGSRILDPSEYLVDGADPSRSVRPGDTFDAVIAINSPSAAATSFKLNVCYRLEGGQLRCADKDFR